MAWLGIWNGPPYFRPGRIVGGKGEVWETDPPAMQAYPSRSRFGKVFVNAPVFRKDTVRGFSPVQGPAKQKIRPVLILESNKRPIHNPCAWFECQTPTRNHEAERAVEMFVHDQPLIMAADSTHGLCVHKHAMVFKILVIERCFAELIRFGFGQPDIVIMMYFEKQPVVGFIFAKHK